MVSTQLKHISQTWIMSAGRGKNKTCLKPPRTQVLDFHVRVSPTWGETWCLMWTEQQGNICSVRVFVRWPSYSIYRGDFPPKKLASPRISDKKKHGNHVKSLSGPPLYPDDWSCYPKWLMGTSRQHINPSPSGKGRASNLRRKTPQPHRPPARCKCSGTGASPQPTCNTGPSAGSA